MIFTKHRLLFSVLFFAVCYADAKVIDLYESALVKKTIISGVLSPASVSVNGKEIFQSTGAFEALLINGVEAKVTDAGGLKTFYEVAAGDKIDLKWKHADGSLENIVSLGYPVISDMKFEHDHLIINFNELTASAVFNSQKLTVPRAELYVSAAKQWFSEPHTLELSSDKNLSQIYNLDFSKYRKEMFTDISWNLYLGDAPFSGNKKPLMIGAGARILEESGISKEFAMMLGKVYWRAGTDTNGQDVSQEAIQLKYRHAYNPFDAEPTGWSYKRLSVGAFAEIINYKRDSQYEMSVDGYNQKSVNVWYYQAGPLIRFEPYRYKDLGFFIHFDIRILRSHDGISSDGDMKYLGFSYYFDSGVMSRLGMKQP